MIDEQTLTNRFERNRSPFLEHLGVRFAVTDSGPEMRCVIGERHMRSHDIAHGGVLCTLLDTALGACAYAAAHERLVETQSELVTLQLEIHFLRPAWNGEELTGRGEVVHHGRSTLVVRGDLTNAAGDRIASGAGTFVPTNIAPKPNA